MKKSIVLLSVLMMLGVFVLSGCNNSSSNAKQTDKNAFEKMTFEEGAASVLFDPKLWDIIKRDEVVMLKSKGQDGTAFVDVLHIPSDLTPDQNVEKAKLELEKASVGNKVTVGKFGNNSMLSFAQKSGNEVIQMDVVYVKSGPAYYRIIFACNQKNYEKKKAMGYEVVKTFKEEKKYTETVFKGKGVVPKTFKSIQLTQLESAAVTACLNNMDVFNKKDLELYKKTYLLNRAKEELTTQFDTLKSKNFVLNNVEVESSTDENIKGYFVYTSEPIDPSQSEKNVLITDFSMVKVGNGWCIYEAKERQVEENKEAVLKLKAKGLEKYGVENLNDLQ